MVNRGDGESNGVSFDGPLNPEAPVTRQYRSGPDGTLVPLGPGEGIRLRGNN